MIYSEAAYFDRVPVAHCAAWEDARRLKKIDDDARRAARRRPAGRKPE